MSNCMSVRLAILKPCPPAACATRTYAVRCSYARCSCGSAISAALAMCCGVIASVTETCLPAHGDGLQSERHHRRAQLSSLPLILGGHWNKSRRFVPRSFSLMKLTSSQGSELAICANHILRMNCPVRSTWISLPSSHDLFNPRTNVLT